MQTKRKEKPYLPPNLELVQAGNAKRQKNLQKYKQKISYPLYAGTAALLFCKILRFDMTESRPLLIKFAYITFAALILMFPPCMKKRIQEKEQPALLPTSLAVGFVLILMEFGFVMCAVW